MKKISFLSMLALGLSLQANAQDLIVSLTNSSTETFPVSDILSIKFGSETMILNELDGTVNTWLIDDIDNYSFDGTANLSYNENLLKEDVNVYPNPASEKLNIEFSSNISQNISITIVDASGKLVYKVFNGIHQDKNTYIWTPQSQGKVKVGNYFCKIITENKIITQPIVVQ